VYNEAAQRLVSIEYQAAAPRYLDTQRLAPSGSPGLTQYVTVTAWHTVMTRQAAACHGHTSHSVPSHAYH
jgi:hypothetical protein